MADTLLSMDESINHSCYVTGRISNYTTDRDTKLDILMSYVTQFIFLFTTASGLYTIFPCPETYFSIMHNASCCMYVNVHFKSAFLFLFVASL